MSLVFWDTNIFVYLFEDHPEFAPRAQQIWDRMEKRGDTLCTSALTVGEALVAPYRAGDMALASRYQAAFALPSIEVLSFGTAESERYARIRATMTVKPADAMQLACASVAEVDLFLTNDRAIASKDVPGIRFITTLEHCPL